MITVEKEGRTGDTRLAFGETLLQLARAGYEVVGIAADTSKSMRLDLLQDHFPERVYEVGIAEQNMMMVAAGLAAMGKIPFVASYSVFTSMRGLEQLRTFVAYPGLDVKVVAGLGGFSAGIEGPTHTALEDLGIISCIPNICLINPADAVSTRQAIRGAADHPGPVYIRIGRDASPVVFGKDYKLQIGRANLLREEGHDLSMLVTGLPVYQALVATELLRKQGIGARLLELHTLKPMDRDAVLAAARDTGAVLIIQEHYRMGALASIVSDLLVSHHPVPVEIVAVKDEFTETGTPDELRELYGITTDRILAAALHVLKRKGKG